MEGREAGWRVEALGGILAGGSWSDWTVGVTHREEAPAATPALEELDERALVDACLNGRRDAFDVLVTRHQRAVYRLCYRFVGNHDDAADLAQDVFLRAYRSLRGFKGNAALATWLYRIAVNVSLNRVSVKVPPTGPLDESGTLAAHPHDPAAALIREETAGRVRSAVARLPRKQRATLILRVYHELSHKEIAAVLGTSVGAVKANFFHALNNLKRALSSSPEADHGPLGEG
jgi:RNA polymerase sigma-70 factor (ECF subfamily)